MMGRVVSATSLLQDVWKHPFPVWDPKPFAYNQIPRLDTRLDFRFSSQASIRFAGIHVATPMKLPISLWLAENSKQGLPQRSYPTKLPLGISIRDVQFRSMGDTCGGDWRYRLVGSVKFAACSVWSRSDDGRRWLKTHNNSSANPESRV